MSWSVTLLATLCSPPFDATNHLTLAVKINAGKFTRIPARYSEDLYRAIRWMLNIDVSLDSMCIQYDLCVTHCAPTPLVPQQSKRPSVEELDRLPRPKGVTRETGLALREYQVR